MRNILIGILISLMAIGLLITDAQAKRFGGGKSFGTSRSTSTFSRPQTANNTVHPQTAAKPASTASKWLGPLAGLAIGGLLASLFMGHGLGTGILSWLAIAAVAFLVWRVVRGLLASSAMNRPAQNMQFQTQPNQPFSSVPPTASGASVLHQSPVEFNEAAFLRHTKSLFIRLQAAYDHKDMADLHEFTSPEVFAEIQLQLQERGNQQNQTEVVSIDAELLDLSNESERTVATVSFSGWVREEANAGPVEIKEMWHFYKNNAASDWVVAGIQQQ